jgi:hypothetical protein
MHIGQPMRLFAPTEFLSVYFTCRREGAPPFIPSWKSYMNNNRLFLGGDRIGAVVPILGGAHSWLVAGAYHFSLLNGPENLDSLFPLSMCPWEAQLGKQTTDFAIPAANFLTSGILNNTVVGPNSPTQALLLQTMISEP